MIEDLKERNSKYKTKIAELKANQKELKEVIEELNTKVKELTDTRCEKSGKESISTFETRRESE